MEYHSSLTLPDATAFVAPPSKDFTFYCTTGSSAANALGSFGYAFIDPDHPGFRLMQTNNIDGNPELTIAGYPSNEADVEIPEEINGIPVTALNDSLFKDNINLMSVVIPDSVTSIGSSAFYG